jgi:hypothetical protein
MLKCNAGNQEVVAQSETNGIRRVARQQHYFWHYCVECECMHCFDCSLVSALTDEMQVA